MISISTDIVPLCEDLAEIISPDFLISTFFKRWCIEKGISEAWNKCLEYARANSYSSYDPPIEFNAINIVINSLYKNDINKVVGFVYGLLSAFVEWKNEAIEIDEVCKDLRVIGVNDEEINKLCRLSQFPLSNQEDTEMTEEQKIRKLEARYQKLYEDEPNSHETIEAYLDWYDATLLYLSDFYTVASQDFLRFKSLENDGNGYTLRDNYKSIRGIYNLLMKQTSKQDCVLFGKNKNKMKVFISHAHEDKDFVEALVELLEGIGLDKSNLFCSSIPGYGIPLNENIFDYIKAQFRENELFVIFVHTANYYNSPICLNEMGAAWILQTDCCSLLSKEMEFEEMKGVVNQNKIAIKVNTENAPLQLTELKDRLVNLLGLPPIDNQKWERKRNIFLKAVL